MSNTFLKKILWRKSFYDRFNISLERSLIENAIAISREHKYLYCRIYKAANSTIVSSLYFAETSVRIDRVQDIQEIKDNYFVRPSQLRVSELNRLRSFFKFTFVRNPYSRIWSAYLDKIYNKDRPQRKIVVTALGKDINDSISFDEFLCFLENGGLKTNGHWAPQSDFLVFPAKDYDAIGRVESLSADLSMILCKIYQQECEIVNVNDHKTVANRAVSNMSSSEKERVFKLYEEDFNNFSYQN